jgi:hypothetical protein
MEMGRVMNPMAQARGLQLPRNDKGAASGRMTAAEQDRNPAACAPSGAWVRTTGMNPSGDVGHFTLAMFPARNPPNVQWARCYLNRCPRRTGVPEQTGSVSQQRGDGAHPPA